jgi:hypothetical protein
LAWRKHLEILPREVQEVRRGHGPSHRCSLMDDRALPNHSVVVALAAHSSTRKVPENGSKGAEPAHTKDHVVAIQWNHEQVHGELLDVDEDVDRATDTRSGDMVTISDLDAEIRSWKGVQVEATSCDNEDEGMRGAGVDERPKYVTGHGYIQLHHVASGEARDGIERNQWVIFSFGIYGVVHLQQVKSLHWAYLHVLA